MESEGERVEVKSSAGLIDGTVVEAVEALLKTKGFQMILQDGLKKAKSKLENF